MVRCEFIYIKLSEWGELRAITSNNPVKNNGEMSETFSTASNETEIMLITWPNKTWMSYSFLMEKEGKDASFSDKPAWKMTDR